MKSIWFHWTVAHAASMSTLVGWVVLYDSIQRVSQELRQNDAAFFIAGAVGILIFLACLQQYMLRLAGWQAPLWAVCSVLGLLIGGILGNAAGEIGRDIGVSFNCRMFATTFIPGCVFGLIQFIAVRSSSRRRICWMIANGLALTVATAMLRFFSFPFLNPEKMVPIATVFGACYGVITGGALVYLLRSEQQRHRRESAPSSE